jgi:uncharacterized protein (DUF362 family)
LKPRVYIDRQHDPSGLAKQIGDAINFIGGTTLVPGGARVFVKPNLTWRRPEAGVTTTPAFLKAAVEALCAFTSNVIIGESDGGYHGFRAEEAFESHGLYELARRYNVEVVNLTKLEAESVAGVVGGKQVSIDLPKRLLHDTDVFLTLPVPKVHSTTRVSLAFKNQWGCIPSPMRMHHHAEFARKVILINRVLRSRIALFDATYMLNRTGPMIGDPVQTNLVLASDDLGAGSLACCHVMGLDPWCAPQHRMARREGVMPANRDCIEFNQPLEPFCKYRFYLKRSLVNWAAAVAFKSEVLTHVLYDSSVADVCHRALYSVRKHRLAAKFLYGDLGPPEIEGRRAQV